MSFTKLDSPLFIIGNPRSGTSLLRLVMTSHSKVLVPPECGFVIWLNKKYCDWQKADSSNSQRLSIFLEDLFACKKFETWLLDKNFIKDKIVARQPSSYAELCQVVYETFGMSIGKDFSVWGDKNNFYLNHLNDLLDLFPNARFLHIVRDGRDVACSYREVMASKSNSTYAPKLNTVNSDIALEWSNNILKIDSFMESMPSHQVMTIKYEDLVLYSLPTIMSICEWLKLPFEAEMLNFYLQNKNKKLEPDLTMDWKKRTLQPISGDTVGRYSNILNDREQSEFLAIAVKALQKFSYI